MEIGLPFLFIAIITILNVSFYFYFSPIIFKKFDILKPKVQDPVSVIVCAKNEAENLRELIPILLQQNYPNFELILINDSSTDDTKDVIEYYTTQDRRVKMVDVVSNESFWGNKKYALTLGIKKAIYEKMLFTDADCRPLSNEWIATMSASLEHSKSIVIGYGAYETIKKNTLNAVIRFETILAAFQYLGYAARGNAYMGVGRNLAYTNKQFYDVRGFMDHMKIMGGDDDLFVNQASTKNNTQICFDENSITLSKAKTDWKSWWIQKRRHVNVSQFYKRKHKITLGLFYFSQLAFYLVSILSLLLLTNWAVVTAVILIRYIIVWYIVGRGMLRFRESDLIPYFPILEIILVFSQFALFVSNNKEPKRWR